VRAVIFDLGLNPAGERKITAILSLVGVVVIAYGIWLSATIVARGA